MPFGNIPTTSRLGISNVTTRDASGFASTVLSLPANSPIYQEQLVHSTEWREGPQKAAAGICGYTDTDISNISTIRQVSGHDSMWSRYNISLPLLRENFEWHRATYYNQIYYVNNEPETKSLLRTLPECDLGDCWNPRNNSIDPALSPYFPNPNSQFWEYFPNSQGAKPPGHCPDDGLSSRIRPDAMAFVFLRMRRLSTPPQMNRGHTVLPPSAAITRLGFVDPYWQTFFDCVRNGVTINGVTEPGITPAELKVIHVHRYTDDPSSSGQTPSSAVARDASFIRQGVDWFRNRYNSNPLPADILLSEMGLNWEIQSDLRWAGGWTGFATGLAWWNTWLCWLTRIGPAECNLQGWETGAHTIHACAHEASYILYTFCTDTPDEDDNGNRTQWYFNTDAWGQYGYYGAPVRRIDALAIQSPSKTYLNSFMVFDSVTWWGRVWRRTPFGACYTVWAYVGADPNVQNYQLFGQGWVESTSYGESGKATVSLPAGYSTVYFPVIKDFGTFPSTLVAMKWYREPGDGALCWFGSMSMQDFANTSTIHVDDTGYNQNVYTAMVYPAVCYSSVPRTIKVSLFRWAGGPRLWFGRPVVLPGACSWFAEQ